MKFCNAFVLASVCLLSFRVIDTQQTFLYSELGKLYRSVRLFIAVMLGDTNMHIENLRQAGKVQLPVPKDFKFCNTKSGPGRRSDVPPTSVHRLRPGDIDIVGAIGDSLTAGSAIYSKIPMEVLVENRGSVWSIGGDDSWRTHLTLPNILKEFNPNLYGFSVGTRPFFDYSLSFNVAELGAMSRDVPLEAEVFVHRLKADPKVNMTHHWKLITIFIGCNDFCYDLCTHSNPENILKLHEKDMMKTLRYLRDNVPRLFVNLVPAPNLKLLTTMVGRSAICEITLRLDCPCIIGKPKKTIDYYDKIMRNWAELESKIARKSEFNTETFTVVFQPFTKFIDIPRKPSGRTDFRYLSADCFHMSQKTNAIFANSIWNNMLESEGSKAETWYPAFETFKCPSLEHPFLRTRNNSI